MSGGLSGPLNTIAGGATSEVSSMLGGEFGVLIYSILALVVLFIVIAYFKKSLASGNSGK